MHFLSPAQHTSGVWRVGILCLCLLLSLTLTACGSRKTEEVPTREVVLAEEETVDPHAGLVEVPSGLGTTMWVKAYDDVPLNTFDPSAFYLDGSRMVYTGTDCTALWGVDVSEHQYGIDWAAVKAAGIDFAMIRLGYRGYSEGVLHVDAYFDANMQGALEQGIQVGVYWFSQAVTTDEAVEEAEYLLQVLSPYRDNISLPVAFDWENIDTDEARTDDLDGDTITQCAIAFCETIRQAGFQPAIYMYRYLAYYLYDLSQLTSYVLWLGAIGDYPDFYYRHTLWQYSVTGQIPGIEGDVDLDLLFTATPAPG